MAGLDMSALERRLRDEIDEAFFQPENAFKPLMHVVDVLLADAKTAAAEGAELGSESPGNRRRAATVSEPSAEDGASQRGRAAANK